MSATGVVTKVVEYVIVGPDPNKAVVTKVVMYVILGPETSGRRQMTKIYSA